MILRSARVWEEKAAFFPCVPLFLARMAELPLEKRKRVDITDPVEARVAMVNGNFPLPDETKAAMRELYKASAEYSAALERIVAKSGLKYDKGRLIHAVDLAQTAKDTACQALILPHACRFVEDA